MTLVKVTPFSGLGCFCPDLHFNGPSIKIPWLWSYFLRRQDTSTTKSMPPQQHTARQLLSGSWCLWNIKQHPSPRAAALHNSGPSGCTLWKRHSWAPGKSTATQLWRRLFRNMGLHSMAVRWGGGWIKAVNSPHPPHSGRRHAGYRTWQSKSKPNSSRLPPQRRECFSFGCARSQLLHTWSLVEARRVLRQQHVASGLWPACGDSSPWPGIQPRSPALGTRGSLTHWTTS